MGTWISRPEAISDKDSLAAHERYQQDTETIQKLDERDEEYQTIRSLFVGKQFPIVKIDKNLNAALEDRYEAVKRKHPGGKEKLLFHGTRCGENHGNIFKVGFQLRYARDGYLGKGIYFADDIYYSDCYGFGHRSLDQGEIRTVIVAKVYLVENKFRKERNIQAIYAEEFCHPQYIVYYRKNWTT
jgi:hypothetical protein